MSYRERLNGIIRGIESANPGWHVWYVYPAMGSIVWCARFGPDRPHASVIHAGSSDELDKLIHESGPTGTGVAGH